MLKTTGISTLFLPSSRRHPIAAKELARTKKRTFNAPVSAFRFWVGAVLLALNAVVLLSYLLGINSYAAKGYEIKQLQNKIAVLNENNQKLNLKVSEAASMVAIQSDFQASDFVPVRQAEYLQLSQYSLK